MRSLNTLWPWWPHHSLRALRPWIALRALRAFRPSRNVLYCDSVLIYRDLKGIKVFINLTVSRRLPRLKHIRNLSLCVHQDRQHQEQCQQRRDAEGDYAQE